MVTPALYVAAPAVAPWRHGLLDAAEVIEETDPHFAFGTEYQPLFCGPSYSSPAACTAGSRIAAGTPSASVGTTRNATLTLNAPVGAYSIQVDWGDGSQSLVSAGNATHTYTANGTYTIAVQGQQGYQATVGPVTVTNGSATGPFTSPATQDYLKTSTDGVPVVSGSPLAVYNLQTCRTVGMIDEAKDRAEQALALGQGRAVETAFEALIGPAAVDITPGGTAVDPADGLAYLEGYAAKNYGGLAVIHMPRGVASILAARQVLSVVDGQLQTVLGTPVAAGGGYLGSVGPSAAAVGAVWMFVTGTVVLRRGPIISPGPALKTPFTNEFAVLAERPYVASWECIDAAVEIKGGACCGSTVTPVTQQGPSDDSSIIVSTVSLTGPDSWDAPDDVLNVDVTVTEGTAEVDGNPVNAPTHVSVDSPTLPLQVTVATDTDRVTITWTVPA